MKWPAKAFVQLWYDHISFFRRCLNVRDPNASLLFQSGSQEKPSRPVTQFSHTLFVSVRTIICRLEQDVEFLMALYDAREGRTFTENFVIRWSKEELAKNQDQNLNMRVLFTVNPSQKKYPSCSSVNVLLPNFQFWSSPSQTYFNHMIFYHKRILSLLKLISPCCNLIYLNLTELNLI